MDRLVFNPQGSLNMQNTRLYNGSPVNLCRYWRRRLGLVVRYSHRGNYRFCYSSRGAPGGTTPSLLLLHGFSATKDMWLPVVKVFTRKKIKTSDLHVCDSGVFTAKKGTSAQLCVNLETQGW